MKLLLFNSNVLLPDYRTFLSVNKDFFIIIYNPVKLHSVID